MSLKPKNVLVVEDDADLRGMYRVALTFAGFTVRDASDGFDALRSLDRAPTDLVILDLALPRVHGLKVLEDIRSQNTTLPVVVVTGSAAELLNVDAQCILRKPVTPEKLVATVKECLASGDVGS